MDDVATYDSYVKFAELVGSPVQDFETWSKQRHNNFAVEREAETIRKKWLSRDK